MTVRNVLYLLVLPAFLFCGEAAAKNKQDRPLTSSVQAKQTQITNGITGKVGKRGAATATKGAAATAASELKRRPKLPPPPCGSYCNDKPGGLPAPYPNRNAR